MSIIDFNKNRIIDYLNAKKIEISNMEDIFNKMKIEIGKKRDNLYACVDQDDPFKMIISEDIPLQAAIKSWGKINDIDLFLTRIVIINDDIKRYLEKIPEFVRINKNKPILVDIYI